MPAVSQRQFRWLHTDDAKEKLGSEGVKEWESATGSPKDLPETKRPSKFAHASGKR
jgi:hypothetical protein